MEVTRDPEERVKAMAREGGVRRMEVRGDEGEEGRGVGDGKLDRDKEKGC